MFSLVPSLIYGKESGKISLKINFPVVVTKYLSFCSSVNNLCLNDDTGTAILVCKDIYLLS